MLTVVIVVVVALGAGGIAFLVNRRRPDAPTAPQFAAPQQLDRADFEAVATPWLLVLFSSNTCLSCMDARSAIDPIDVAELTVLELHVEEHRSIHDRYHIDAVPTLVLADREGVVRWSFLGAPPLEVVQQALADSGVVEPDDGTPVSL